MVKVAPTITPMGCLSLLSHLNGSPVVLKNLTVAGNYFKHIKSCLLTAEEFTLKRTPFE